MGYILHVFGKTGELSSTSRVLDTEDSRRAGFVDMLLDMDTHTARPYKIGDASDGGISVDSGNIEDNNSVYEKKDSDLLNRTGKF